MDNTQAASDKIRPFLEAMERSIDRVRSRRMQESGELSAPTPAAPMANAPAPSNPSPERFAQRMQSSTQTPAPPAPPATPVAPASTNSDDAPPPRLKARPKRPSSFTNTSYEQDNYRSQAG
jgi:hypothetical protein